jgi:WD40 repeat protein
MINLNSINSCSYSDNNRLLAIDDLNFVYLYDTENGQLIRKDSMPLAGYNNKLALLSPDGTKMIAKTGADEIRYYTLDQDGWTEIGRTELNPSGVFYSKDGSSVYIAAYQVLLKLRSDNFSLVSQYPLPEGSFKSVDLDRGRLLCSDTWGVHRTIIDLNTGQILRTLVTGLNPCILFDNFLVASGLQLTLTEF